MTSDPIDKVARALCEADGKDAENVKAISALRVYAEYGEDEWSHYWVLAIAALRAIREPTDEMVTAMSDALTDDSAFSSDSKQTWTQVAQLIGISAFQAAIDKALET